MGNGSGTANDGNTSAGDKTRPDAYRKGHRSDTCAVSKDCILPSSICALPEGRCYYPVSKDDKRWVEAAKIDRDEEQDVKEHRGGSRKESGYGGRDYREAHELRQHR
jgi:hypothetical protein